LAQEELTRELESLIADINSKLRTQLDYQVRIAVAAGARAEELEQQLSAASRAASTTGERVERGASRAATAWGRTTDVLKGGASVIGSLPRLAEDAADAMRDASAMGRDAFGPILTEFGGGIDFMTNATNQQAATLVDVTERTLTQFYDMTEEGTSALGQPLWMMFDSHKEMMEGYVHITKTRMTDSYDVIKSTNENLAVEMGLFSKNAGITADQLATFVSREISLTGESTGAIFREVQGFADQVEKQTGISSKKIVKDIEVILKNTENFGNVTVEEAARISATLTQLGVDFGSLNGAVGQFQSYEQAATAVGNLTSVFGVNIDAMEMMQLANEDQEQFLHRMREQMLGAGMDADNLTQAQKRLLKSQLGFTDVEAVERFLDPSRAISSFEELQEATDPTEISEDLESMIDDIRSLDDASEILDRFKLSMSGLVSSKMARETAAFSFELSNLLGSATGIAEQLTGTTLEKVEAEMRASRALMRSEIQADLGSITGASEQVGEAAAGAAEEGSRSAAQWHREFLESMKETSMEATDEISSSVDGQGALLESAIEHAAGAVGMMGDMSRAELESIASDSTQAVEGVSESISSISADMAQAELRRREEMEAGLGGMTTLTAKAVALVRESNQQVESEFSRQAEMTTRQFKAQIGQAGSFQQEIAIMAGQQNITMSEESKSARETFMREWQLTEEQMRAITSSSVTGQVNEIEEGLNDQLDLLQGYQAAGTKIEQMSAEDREHFAKAGIDIEAVLDGLSPESAIAQATEARIQGIRAPEQPETEAIAAAGTGQAVGLSDETVATLTRLIALQEAQAAAGATTAGGVYNVTLNLPDGSYLTDWVISHPGEGGVIVTRPVGGAEQGAA